MASYISYKTEAVELSPIVNLLLFDLIFMCICVTV
jgi:hypothetical protein